MRGGLALGWLDPLWWCQWGLVARPSPGGMIRLIRWNTLLSGPPFALFLRRVAPCSPGGSIAGFGGSTHARTWLVLTNPPTLLSH